MGGFVVSAFLFFHEGRDVWHKSWETQSLKSRDGILEQFDRIVMQDKLTYLVNLAIAAVQAGYTTREIEIALRRMRGIA